jgi:hypothetical protein
LHEIEEIEEAADLTDADKAALLYGNAERCYGYTGAEATRPAVAAR